jgi:hypothetical protein
VGAIFVDTEGGTCPRMAEYSTHEQLIDRVVVEYGKGRIVMEYVRLCHRYFLTFWANVVEAYVICTGGVVTRPPWGSRRNLKVGVAG